MRFPQVLLADAELGRHYAEEARRKAEAEAAAAQRRIAELQSIAETSQAAARKAEAEAKQRFVLPMKLNANN